MGRSCKCVQVATVPDRLVQKAMSYKMRRSIASTKCEQSACATPASEEDPKRISCPVLNTPPPFSDFSYVGLRGCQDKAKVEGTTASQTRTHQEATSKKQPDRLMNILSGADHRVKVFNTTSRQKVFCVPEVKARKTVSATSKTQFPPLFAVVFYFLSFQRPPFGNAGRY